MPTKPGATSIQTLDPKAATEKFAGLITEVDITSPPPDDPAEVSAPPAETPPPAPATEEEETPSAPEAPPAEEPAAPERYEVKVDGELMTVDLDELKAGFSRTEDYHRKTRALADERRAFEAERESTQSDAARYRESLTQLRQALEQLQGEPNWDELHKTVPPEEFLRRKADWELKRANLDRIRRHEQEEVAAAQQTEAAQYAKRLRDEQDKLRAAVPEWDDQAKAHAEHLHMIAAAKQYGYTEQEVRAVTDHRALLLLRDAMRYRDLQREPAVPPKVRTAAIKTARPGTPARPVANERQTKLIEQAAKSHRQRDAMHAIESLLPD